jgi:hypothetical protein
MKWRLYFCLLAMMGSMSLRAQLPAGMPQPVFLYPQGAPDALGQDEADKPRLYPFLAAAISMLPSGMRACRLLRG